MSSIQIVAYICSVISMTVIYAHCLFSPIQQLLSANSFSSITTMNVWLKSFCCWNGKKLLNFLQFPFLFVELCLLCNFVMCHIFITFQQHIVIVTFMTHPLHNRHVCVDSDTSIARVHYCYPFWFLCSWSKGELLTSVKLKKYFFCIIWNHKKNTKWPFCVVLWLFNCGS